MKKFSLVSLFALAVLLAPPMLRAETYVATLKGVECNDCKKTITRSLGKLKGVETILIKQKGKDTHQLTIITGKGNTLTQAQANQALKNAEHYQLTNWSKLN